MSDSRRGGETNLANVHILRSKFANFNTAIIRDRAASPSEVRNALRNLGAECAREISNSIPFEPRDVWTPMNERASGLMSPVGVSAVVTTKADFEVFGMTIANALNTSIIGYMDFGSVRGRAALSAPIREVELPTTASKVQRLVIAKSVMATGCTAVSLTQSAIEVYKPAEVIIASIFYSQNGIDEVVEAFPNASIYVINEPDSLSDDGMLLPGVGNLDKRM